MTTTSTVNGRTTVRTTPGTILSITINSVPANVKVSLHDCTDPGQVGIHNMVWPTNMATPHRSGALTVKNGIVVHDTGSDGTTANVTVVHQ